MFYNNLLSIPVLIVATLVVEDWSTANIDRNFPTVERNNILLAMILSGLSSVFISYTSAWCVRVTSSTTYSMVGALNKLPIALSGLIFFDAPVTFPSVSAIGVGFVSGIVYAIAKVKQNAKPKTGILPTANPPLSASSQSMRDSLRSWVDVRGAIQLWVNKSRADNSHPCACNGKHGVISPGIVNLVISLCTSDFYDFSWPTLGYDHCTHEFFFYVLKKAVVSLLIYPSYVYGYLHQDGFPETVGPNGCILYTRGVLWNSVSLFSFLLPFAFDC